MPLSDTPRVDLFASSLPPIRMEGASPNIDMAKQVRALMVAWSELARDLERENARAVAALREAMMAVHPGDWELCPLSKEFVKREKVT